MDEDTLCRLAMSPVFLFCEFLESGIAPIVERASCMDEDEREAFYVSLLPYLVAHCKDLGIPVPYETALFLIDVVRSKVAHIGAHSSSTH